MDYYREQEPKPAPKSIFISMAILLFFASLSAADSIGFVPYYVDGTSPRARVEAGENEVSLADLPQLGSTIPTPTPVAEPVVAIKPDRIRSAAIGLDLNVQNPETRDIHALDELLKNGPARYVDSALLGQNGNVLIFAHSSRLPVVHNQMYKAFNRVAELKPGETITVSGEGKEYLYSVTSVRRANAEEELISLAPAGKKLTLVTCDTLTSKSSRFISEISMLSRVV